MEDSHSLPLHQCHIHKLWASLNKTYAFLHFLALLAIFYYRGAFFFNKTHPRYNMVPFLPWLTLFAAELVLSFLWALKQPVSWRPVTRTVFPERLPRDDDQLPGIDVFICTADPEKEPTLEVMNTVISAMALDYPPQKLSVYLSDDGGASVTLKGMKEAWAFATWWLPFCRKYNVKPICPWAYFQEPEEESQSKEFLQDRKIVKEKYEIFKHRRETKMRGEIEEDTKTNARKHPPLIQVISGNSIEEYAATVNPEQMEMPLLVYVAREKRPSHPHNFKAGALNVLLRVSSTMSNSPYILVLDCDMYCNDSISARQAICFYLDPKLSPSLGWVQYPQKFHNINESDIYDSQMRTVWHVYWRGADGLQGPVISGTNFYIKRASLYDIDTDTDHGYSLKELRDSFGPSNDFIKSISQSYKRSRELISVLQQEAEFLASCTYEKDTKWGKEVGFRYESVVEDIMTGFRLQSKGLRSVYLNPKTPQFLGSATTNLNEALTQGIRWYSGILGVGLSKYCPLIYRPSRMQFLHKMFSSWIAFFPLEVFPDYCLATIPPLCLIYGIPLYPKVSDPLFIPFAFVFISSRLKQLYEVHISGGTLNSWLNEQRMGAIKAITCYVYGTLDCLMTKLGLKEASFTPTNKAGGDDKTKYYNMGKYDFRTSYMFLVPLVTLVTLNLACFVGGVSRIIIIGWTTWDEMFAHVVLSFYLLVMSFPVVEGMVLRKDNGRVPSLASFISMVVCLVFLIIVYFFLY